MTIIDYGYEHVGTSAMSTNFSRSVSWKADDRWFDHSVAFSDLWKRQLAVELTDLSAGRDEPRADLRAVEHALVFLELLPDETPEPEMVVESDGEIAFDWDAGRRATFSVSIGPDGTLRYGGLFGYRTRSGTDQLVTSIPREILEHIAATRAVR